MFYSKLNRSKKPYFPEVDAGNHKSFTQIKVPATPAPVKAIWRQAPDVYCARTPGETSYWPTFGQALAAIYPELPPRTDDNFAGAYF